MGKVKNILRELFLKRGAISYKYLIVFFLSCGTLFSQGSVVTWGPSNYGGYFPDALSSDLSSGVIKIVPTHGAFAALKNDGSVVVWYASGSSSNYGGNSSSVSSSISSGVTEIYSTGRAFAALKTDGSVITWGDGQ
ncbi:hypothetical protein OAQ42_05735 [Flavobacteriaceae bacterium]|nr:hypothetical protein [Flavobacteriaceae bacterium]